MKQNKQKEPMKETTKDDSSDVKKVKQSQANAQHQEKTSSKSKENEDAQKGHA